MAEAVIDQLEDLYLERGVLNDGFVRLDDHMADDLSVVNSARVSYGKKVDLVSEADEKLISYLIRNNHGTPFEHNAFRFHVRAPIFVFREWHRHRIGHSYNEMSARYMQLPASWYVPEIENVRIRVGKPGHYKYEPARPEVAKVFIEDLNRACADNYEQYTSALEAGIAPEQARCFLHVNHYSEMYCTCNARSLMNFLSLRNTPTAQWEIQQYAKLLEVSFQRLMPVTAKAFIDNNRVAP